MKAGLPITSVAVGVQLTLIPTREVINQPADVAAPFVSLLKEGGKAVDIGLAPGGRGGREGGRESDENQ